MKDQEDHFTHQNLGDFYYRKYDYDNAIKSYKKAIKLNPNNFIRYKNLGHCYYEKKEFDNAIEAYKEAIIQDLDELDFSEYYTFFDLHYEKKEFSHVISPHLLSQVFAASKKPDNLLVHLNLGHCYREKKECDNVAKSYKKAIEIIGNSWTHYNFTEWYYSIAECYRDQTQYNQAIEYYKEAIEIKSDHFWAHYNLAKCYHKKNEFESAIASYETASILNPDNFLVHINLGHCYREKKEGDNAIKSYKKSIEIKSDHFWAHYNLAECYHEKNEFESAIASYETASILNPDNFLVHINLGHCYRGKNEFDKAIILYAKAISLNPNSLWTHNLTEIPMLEDKGIYQTIIAPYKNENQKIRESFDIDQSLRIAKLNTANSNSPQNISNWKIIHMAAWQVDKSTIKSLIHENVKLIAADDGWTPLHALIASPYTLEEEINEIASMFCNNGLDINAKTNEGDTVLHLAVNLNSIKRSIFLISKNSLLTYALNSKDRTPVMLAEETGNAELLFELYKGNI